MDTTLITELINIYDFRSPFPSAAIRFSTSTLQAFFDTEQTLKTRNPKEGFC